MADIAQDFADLLKLFNAHGVRYCLVGAFAVAFHAIPRYTKDLDLLVAPSVANGRRIVRALEDFGFGSLQLTPADFAQPGHFVQLGYEPVRVDLITSVEGCSFRQVWKGRQRGEFVPGLRVNYIGINDLLQNKQIANRPQDKADLLLLRAAQGKNRQRRRTR